MIKFISYRVNIYIQSYEDAQFLGPKWHISRMRIFFRKPVNVPCSFIHAYLHAKNQSQIFISEISTIKEYWNLIGREQFLAITWEPDFSQACNFRKMLMNHKNFCFTYSPDKTNNTIFLSKKSPKTLFWGHFWPFLVIYARWRFFPKNPVLSHVTMLSFRKNESANSEGTYGLTEGRTDGPYFIGTFRPRPGVQKVKQSFSPPLKSTRLRKPWNRV